jgi:hypothetical protein
MQNAEIIGLARELSMKMPNCIKTDLTAAFRGLRGTYPGTPLKNHIGGTNQISKSFRQFD